MHAANDMPGLLPISECSSLSVGRFDMCDKGGLSAHTDTYSLFPAKETGYTPLPASCVP